MEWERDRGWCWIFRCDGCWVAGGPLRAVVRLWGCRGTCLRGPRGEASKAYNDNPRPPYKSEKSRDIDLPWTSAICISKMQNNEQNLRRKLGGCCPPRLLAPSSRLRWSWKGQAKTDNTHAWEAGHEGKELPMLIIFCGGGGCVKGGIQTIAGLPSGLVRGGLAFQGWGAPWQVDAAFHTQYTALAVDEMARGSTCSSATLIASHRHDYLQHCAREVWDIFMRSRASLAWSMTQVCPCQQWPHLNIPRADSHHNATSIHSRLAARVGFINWFAVDLWIGPFFWNDEVGWLLTLIDHSAWRDLGMYVRAEQSRSHWTKVILDNLECRVFR